MVSTVALLVKLQYCEDQGSPWHFLASTDKDALVHVCGVFSLAAIELFSFCLESFCLQLRLCAFRILWTSCYLSSICQQLGVWKTLLAVHDKLGVILYFSFIQLAR